MWWFYVRRPFCFWFVQPSLFFRYLRNASRQMWHGRPFGLKDALTRCMVVKGHRDLTDFTHSWLNISHKTSNRIWQDEVMKWWYFISQRSTSHNVLWNGFFWLFINVMSQEQEGRGWRSRVFNMKQGWLHESPVLPGGRRVRSRRIWSVVCCNGSNLVGFVFIGLWPLKDQSLLRKNSPFYLTSFSVPTTHILWRDVDIICNLTRWQRCRAVSWWF